MRKKTAPYRNISIGFSSIIVVFITVLLVTFVTLSVLTAQSDYRLSHESAKQTKAYYEADAFAKDMAKLLDQQLYELYLSSSSVKEFYGKISELDFLTNAPLPTENISLNTSDTSASISYTIPVSETQNLHVSLKINYPLSGNECFSTITRWQTVTENTPESR